MKNVIALTTVAALLAGCASIDTVNGVPVNRAARVSTQNAPTYCPANPAICVLGGVIGLGLLGRLVNQGNGGNGCSDCGGDA